MTEDRQLGRVTVLAGERGGRYPHGNSLLVRGGEATMLIDPSLSLFGRSELPRVDLVVNSHCHEDHVAGSSLFPEASHHVPELELSATRSVDEMMAIYGFSPAADLAFRRVLIETFRFVPRASAVPFANDAVFELEAGACAFGPSLRPGTRSDTRSCTSNPTASCIWATST